MTVVIQYIQKPSGLWRITLENEIIDIAASDENDAKKKGNQLFS